MGENVIARGTLISTMLEFENKKQMLESRGFSSLFEWTQEQHCSEKEEALGSMWQSWHISYSQVFWSLDFKDTHLLLSLSPSESTTPPPNFMEIQLTSNIV